MGIIEFLNRLQGVTGGAGQWSAKCPAHDDGKASLRISVGENGKILVKCLAGCETDSVLDAMGLSVRDLFADTDEKVFPSYSPSEKKAPFVATYRYPGGVEKLRRADKSFLWRVPDGRGGWDWHKPKEKLLYTAGRTFGPGSGVCLVEGEKDVDALHRLKFNGATGPDGAGPGKWKRADQEKLRGCHVCVIPDNDDVGRAYADEVCRSLQGVAASVRYLDLATIWPEITDHGDFSDMVQALGDDEALKRFTPALKGAPEWKATAVEQMSIQEEKPKSKLISAASVPYDPPHWVLAPYFQIGKGTLIQADNGTGKTAFMCSVAAHVSTGMPLLGLPVAEPGAVVMISVEDDPGVLRGRIEADGGDLNKVFFPQATDELTFLSTDIEGFIREVNAKLLIFDPLQNFLGPHVDLHRANETRPIFSKLFDMCARNSCSCAIISHMGKGSADKSHVNRALGSVDIPAAMRSIIELGRNPEDENELVAVHVKCSNAPRGKSLAFTIGDRGGVQWKGFSSLTADDLTIAQRRKDTGVNYEHEPLVKVFGQLITDHPEGKFLSYGELKSEGAKILGFPPYRDLTDLRNKLDGGLARELQQREGIIVTHGQHDRKNRRGLTIERYVNPQGYQTKLQDV